MPRRAARSPAPASRSPAPVSPARDASTTWIITGAAGHVGRTLAEHVERNYRDVRKMDIAGLAPSTRIDGGGETPRAVLGDIADDAALRSLLTHRETDVVFVHLASAGMSGAPMLDRALCQRVNVDGTAACLRCCRAAAATSTTRVSFVYISTYNVVFHGQPVVRGDESAPYSAAADATDEYSASKAAAEALVLAADGGAGGQLRTLALRPAAIFGEDEERHLPRIVGLMRKGLFAVGFGDAAATQDWLHVDNFVSAIVLAARALRAAPARAGGRAYFVNDDEPVNTNAFFGPLAAALGCRSAPIARLPLRATLVLAAACELAWWYLGLWPFFTRAEVLKAAQQHTYTCDRAKADLGYRPLLSSTEGMRRVAQKYEEAEARRGHTPRPLSYFVLGLLLAVALWWAAGGLIQNPKTIVRPPAALAPSRSCATPARSARQSARAAAGSPPASARARPST